MQYGSATIAMMCVVLGQPASPGKAPARKPAHQPADKQGKPATADPGQAGTPESGLGPQSLLESPHPLITEILYAVPTGDAGDANGDGIRQATGDEFIELWNPHDKAIDLRGYTLTDKSAGKPGALKFVFPACRLAPGQLAVVFNGFECTWTGPVGDSGSAPKEGNKRFGGALVFTMKAEGTRVALSNAGDCVCLIAPDGTTLDVIKWGKVEKPPSGKVVEEAPMTNRGSVQRSFSSAGSGGGGGTGGAAGGRTVGRFVAHEEVDGVRYSPGRYGKGAKPTEAEPSKPEDPPPSTGK